MLPTARTRHGTQWTAPPFVVVLSVQHILHCVPGFRPRGTNLERDILFVIQCTNRCSPPLSSLCSNSEGQYAPWTKKKYHINVIVPRSAAPHKDIPHPRPSIFLLVSAFHTNLIARPSSCSPYEVLRSTRSQLVEFMLSSVRSLPRRMPRRQG